MTEPDPPQASHLALPPAALHAASPRDPHPDSEEFIQHERHRVAQELEPIEDNGALNLSPGRRPPTSSSKAVHSPTLRSRGIRQNHLHRRTSDISTVPDELGPGQDDESRYRLRRQVPHWYDPVKKLWKSHVSVTIDEGAHRDHLALERTFLGYLRTSLALAMTGVLIAQLFRLQHALHPSPDLGYFVLGVPLAATFIGMGILVLLIGAYRFWRQQYAMIRGTVHAGGWEITIIMVLIIVICFVTFVFTVAIDIEKSYR